MAGGNTEDYKIVLLGDYSVGKSSVALKYVKNEFNPNEESTIGASFLSKSVVHKNRQLKFEIWDTAGQERYNSLVPMYYKAAHAILIVYDVTSMRSFERAKDWVKELNIKKPEECAKFLVGNKTDLDRERQVSLEMATLYAAENMLSFSETSAKTGENIEDLFAKITLAVSNIVGEANKKENAAFPKKPTSFGCC